MRKLLQSWLQRLEKSKSSKLQELIPAFSIPLIGRSAAAKLCSVVSDVEEINESTCSQAGLGPKLLRTFSTGYKWITTQTNTETTYPSIGRIK